MTVNILFQFGTCYIVNTMNIELAAANWYKIKNYFSLNSLPVIDCWPDPVPYLTSCECKRTL